MSLLTSSGKSVFFPTAILCCILSLAIAPRGHLPLRGHEPLASLPLCREHALPGTHGTLSTWARARVSGTVRPSLPTRVGPARLVCCSGLPQGRTALTTPTPPSSCAPSSQRVLAFHGQQGPKRSTVTSCFCLPFHPISVMQSFQICPKRGEQHSCLDMGEGRRKKPHPQTGGMERARLRCRAPPGEAESGRTSPGGSASRGLLGTFFVLIIHSHTKYRFLGLAQPYRMRLGSLLICALDASESLPPGSSSLAFSWCKMGWRSERLLGAQASCPLFQ